jgi:hypothetical protein
VAQSGQQPQYSPIDRQQAKPGHHHPDVMTDQQNFVEEKTPSAMALTGTSRITNDRLVAPAVSRMRKYRKYAKAVDSKANPIT